MDIDVLNREALRSAGAGAWEYVRTDERGAQERWRFRASPELRALMGLPPGEFAHDDATIWLQLIDPDDVISFRSALDQCLQGLCARLDVVFRVHHRDGGLRTLHARARVEHEPSGAVRRIVGLTVDETEAYEAQRRALLIAGVFDSALGGLLICNGEHRIIEANRRFMTISGLSLDELRRQTVDQVLFSGAPPEVAERAWATVAERGLWVGGVLLSHRDGRSYRLELRLTAAGSEGAARRYAALVFDLEAQEAPAVRRQTDEVPEREAAPAEALRRRIDAAIREAVELRNGLSVFVLALDRFDAVVETYGRTRTERVLQAAAERLGRLDEAVVVCEHLQNERFALAISDLLEQRDIEQAFARMLDLLDQDFSVDGRSLRLTASAGVAVFPIDGINAELLLQRAENALEDVRRRSRGVRRLQTYTPELSDYAADRIHIEGSLRKALKLGAFECHLQPKVRLEDQRWIGAEALIRWRLGDAWLSPSRFIPIAEESGLIKDLGRWVLWEAASRVAAWRREGLIDAEFRVAVNLAGAQLEPELLRTVRAVLGYTRLPSEVLILELTETVLMENPQAARAVLDELRRAGVGIALDDFGTGYTSIGQLQSLAIDELKIDRSFIRGLPDEPGAQAIVRSLVTLGHGLKLNVIAEGVETEAQRAALLKLGCRCGQGFLFSKALPFDQFEQALLAHRESGRPRGFGRREGE